jgi:G3E family GTPase
LFAAWDWTCDSPLSLHRLRAVFERLPDSIYRAKGIVYLEELPEHRVVLQMVGRRSRLKDAGRWGTERKRTELVMIGIEDGIDGDAMQIALDGCIHDARQEMSPMLRMARAIGA